MIDKKIFIEGLQYLKKFYIRWDVNLIDIADTWFDILNEELQNNETYTKVIKNYTKQCKFAPGSPYDILEIIPEELGVNEAWEVILDIVKRSSTNQIFLNLVKKEQPKLYDFIRYFDIEKIEVDKEGNKCYGYQMGKPFKKAYNDYLKAKEIVKIGTSKQILMIGN